MGKHAGQEKGSVKVNITPAGLQCGNCYQPPEQQGICDNIKTREMSAFLPVFCIYGGLPGEEYLHDEKK